MYTAAQPVPCDPEAQPQFQRDPGSSGTCTYRPTRRREPRARERSNSFASSGSSSAGSKALTLPSFSLLLRECSRLLSMRYREQYSTGSSSSAIQPPQHDEQCRAPECLYPFQRTTRRSPLNHQDSSPRSPFHSTWRPTPLWQRHYRNRQGAAGMHMPPVYRRSSRARQASFKTRYRMRPWLICRTGDGIHRAGRSV